MQDSKTCTRKPWYKRAIEMATPWTSTTPKSGKITTSNSTLWKSSIPKSNTTKLLKTIPKSSENNNRKQLRKCTSLKVATSFTRVCLCASITSYNEVFRADVPPRRSYSYPRSKVSQEKVGIGIGIGNGRISVEGRRVFRGKSLRDDVLMRRFVVEEEAMMQVRRRNQMELIRKRSVIRRKKLGLSPLSRMVLAEED